MEYNKIVNTAINLLVENGADVFDAMKVVNSLAETSLRGIDSHGINLIPRYLKSMKEGKIKLDKKPKIVFENDIFVNVSGESGFGQITAEFGINKGIEKAKKSGISVVGLNDTNHIGTLGQYNLLASKAGFMCFSVCNGGANVAPYGGYERFLGTNPISFSIPVKDKEPMLVDFATSVFPESKVRDYRDKGMKLPKDVILDSNGKDTDNPNDFYDGGSLLSIGGHKGYGLSLMVEILGGLFTGAGFWALGESTSTNGVTFIMIDPTVFRGEAFFGDVQSFIDKLKSQPTIDGVQQILLPGELELQTKRERIVDGVFISSDLLEIINSIESIDNKMGSLRLFKELIDE